MKIISIQTGLPKDVTFQGKTVRTGIFKSKIQGPVHAKTLNLVGDGQADLTVHGGVDKAIYAYSLDAYSWWKKMRPEDAFDGGAMGENLSVDQMLEDQIFIGDTYEVGEAVLQVAQPRFPCYKLGVKFNDLNILKMFIQSKRPGVYFRVLKEGLINADQEFKLIGTEKIKLSLSELFSYVHESQIDPSRAAECINIKSLPKSYRDKFQAVIDGLH
jgi:MOSC domain-containing protein YiiM